MPEQHNIEYKTSWHDDYLKTICAFANSQGGKLYIGKVDKGKTRCISEYKKFDALLLFELVNSASDTQLNKPAKSSASKQKYSTVSELLEKADQNTQDLYIMIKEFIMNMGENIQFKELLYYYAFLKIKTFASIEVRPQKSQVIVYVKLDSNLVDFEKGFTRDVSNIGHLGVGNIEIKINNEEDFGKAKPLILKSYEQS